MNKLKLLSSVMIITISVSGCLGGKQPQRFNTVEGGRRTPALNLQTAQPNVPFPTDDMLYAVPAEPKQGLQPRTNWEEPVEAMVNPQMPNPQMNANTGEAATQPSPQGAQPSPLYYYEQQNAAMGAAAVQSSELAPSEVMPSALEPSPLAKVANAADYPKLNDVPQKAELLEKKPFANAKANADEFIAEQKTGEAAIPAEPQFDEMTLDDFLEKEAAPMQNNAPINNAPVIEPFADANSKKEIAKEMAVQAPPSPAAPTMMPEIVEVKDAAPVVAMPRNQKLYTSGGMIELVPPSSIASRGGLGGRELPRSRYHNRRQLSN